MSGNTVLIVIGIIMMVIVIILVWHTISIKQEIRNIINQLENIKTVSDENHNHYIRINNSDHDLEKLAGLVNQKMKTDLKLKVQMDRQYHQMLQMVSGLAHDFRTPITVVLGYLELMEKDGTENKEYLGAIKNRTIQLNTSVNRLYDYFRIGNRTSVQNHFVDLRLFVPKILGDLYNFINKHDVDVNLDIKCKNCTIIADEEMLSRVMENLFINAAKYNTGKTIDIKIYPGENGYLNASISNYAAPFSNNDLERIFDLFYRKDVSRHDGSSGIGLSMVKAFVEKMNGKVLAEYANKKFTITVSFLATRNPLSRRQNDLKDK